VRDLDAKIPLDLIELAPERVPSVGEVDLHGVVDGVDAIADALDLLVHVVDGGLGGVEDFLLVGKEAGLVGLPGVGLQDLIQGTSFW
jgi:hypothetical protein